MFTQQQVIAPREVFAEIKKGTDELVDWVDQHESSFLEISEEEVNLLPGILVKYPQSAVGKHSTGLWADPLILACAKQYGLTIIHEESNSSGHDRIPYIADLLRIPHMRVVKFFQEESWVFQ